MSIEISLSDVITIISLAIAAAQTIARKQPLSSKPPTFSFMTGFSIGDQTVFFCMQKTQQGIGLEVELKQIEEGGD